MSRTGCSPAAVCLGGARSRLRPFPPPARPPPRGRRWGGGWGRKESGKKQTGSVMSYTCGVRLRSPQWAVMGGSAGARTAAWSLRLAGERAARFVPAAGSVRSCSSLCCARQRPGAVIYYGTIYVHARNSTLVIFFRDFISYIVLKSYDYINVLVYFFHVCLHSLMEFLEKCYPLVHFHS